VKLGIENRLKTVIAVGMFSVAMYLFVTTMFAPDRTPPVTAATQPPAQPGGVRAAPRLATRRGVRSPDRNTNTVASLDPRLRLDVLRASEELEYKGSGRNIFRPHAEPPPQPKPKPKPPVVIEQPPVQVETGPPPPPPINLKFFGFASRPGQPKKVFLASGDDVFIAAEGEIVNRRYRVVSIGATSVEIEDVLNNNRQSIPLTQG
jgi:hypothetical protein